MPRNRRSYRKSISNKVTFYSSPVARNDTLYTRTSIIHDHTSACQSPERSFRNVWVVVSRAPAVDVLTLAARALGVILAFPVIGVLKPAAEAVGVVTVPIPRVSSHRAPVSGRPGPQTERADASGRNACWHPAMSETSFCSAYTLP